MMNQEQDQQQRKEEERDEPIENSLEDRSSNGEEQDTSTDIFSDYTNRVEINDFFAREYSDNSGNVQHPPVHYYGSSGGGVRSKEQQQLQKQQLEQQQQNENIQLQQVKRFILIPPSPMKQSNSQSKDQQQQQQPLVQPIDETKQNQDEPSTPSSTSSETYSESSPPQPNSSPLISSSTQSSASIQLTPHKDKSLDHVMEKPDELDSREIEENQSIEDEQEDLHTQLTPTVSISLNSQKVKDEPTTSTTKQTRKEQKERVEDPLKKQRRLYSQSTIDSEDEKQKRRAKRNQTLAGEEEQENVEDGTTQASFLFRDSNMEREMRDWEMSGGGDGRGDDQDDDNDEDDESVKEEETPSNTKRKSQSQISSASPFTGSGRPPIPKEFDKGDQFSPDQKVMEPWIIDSITNESNILNPLVQIVHFVRDQESEDITLMVSDGVCYCYAVFKTYVIHRILLQLKTHVLDQIIGGIISLDKYVIYPNETYSDYNIYVDKASLKWIHRYLINWNNLKYPKSDKKIAGMIARISPKYFINNTNGITQRVKELMNQSNVAPEQHIIDPMECIVSDTCKNALIQNNEWEPEINITFKQKIKQKTIKNDIHEPIDMDKIDNNNNNTQNNQNNDIDEIEEEDEISKSFIKDKESSLDFNNQIPSTFDHGGNRGDNDDQNYDMGGDSEQMDYESNVTTTTTTTKSQSDNQIQEEEEEKEEEEEEQPHIEEIEDIIEEEDLGDGWQSVKTKKDLEINQVSNTPFKVVGKKNYNYVVSRGKQPASPSQNESPSKLLNQKEKEIENEKLKELKKKESKKKSPAKTKKQDTEFISKRNKFNEDLIFQDMVDESSSLNNDIPKTTDTIITTTSTTTTNSITSQLNSSTNNNQNNSKKRKENQDEETKKIKTLITDYFTNITNQNNNSEKDKKIKKRRHLSKKEYDINKFDFLE